MNALEAPSIAATRIRAPLSQVGPYTILRRLACGGMAELFVARADGAARDELVVLKRILPELANERSMVRMFLDEAAIAASLHHPNVPEVFGVGQAHGHYYYTMEYLRGINVAELTQRLALSGARLPLAHALGIAIGASAGLHYAHEQRNNDGTPLDIVHRDVTPQNIFVTWDGRTVVVDFGIASTPTRFTQTRAGAVKGKLQYLAPEQCTAKQIDRRADVFSLCVVLWEMTTGRRLYRGQSEFELMSAIVDRDARSPSSMCPDYPPELEQIIMRGLSRDPARRQPTAAALCRDLLAFATRNQLDVSENALSSFVASAFSEDSGIDALATPPPEPTAGALELSLPHAALASSDCAVLPSGPYAPDARIVTNCATREEFIATFRHHWDGTSLFVPTTSPLGAGVSDWFSFRLSCGEPVLRAYGTVARPGASASPAGMRIELSLIDPTSEQTFQWLIAAGKLATAPERPPVSDARARAVGGVVDHVVALVVGLAAAYAVWGLAL